MAWHIWVSKHGALHGRFKSMSLFVKISKILSTVIRISNQQRQNLKHTNP